MLNELDRTMLEVAYQQIEKSEIKRVSGSTMWESMRVVVPDIAPVTIPGMLRRLVSLGLLVKDEINSSRRTNVYGATDLGYESLQEAAVTTP